MFFFASFKGLFP